MMSRIIKTAHAALTIIAWGIFISSLIRIAFVWNSLPDKLGIHFADTGEFDLTGNKIGAFYPYLVSVIALIFCEVSALLSGKIKMGLKISEKGDLKIRTALKMLLDIIKLGFSFFFSGVWADCVIRQHPLDTNIPMAVTLIMFLCFFIFIIASIVIKIKNPPEQD